MTDQLKLWQSDFGDMYVDRNQLSEQDILNRMNMWQMVLMGICTPHSVPSSFLEIGAGIGGNMAAINNIYASHGKKPELYAIEPNEKARSQLSMIDNTKIIEKNAFEVSKQNGSVDLVFTSGVLIHIHPDDQLKALTEMYRVSKKWIVCTEYFAPETREILYRGEKSAMWARDYGSLWLDNFKLRCVSSAFHWKRMTGLDNTTTWVFEKVH